MRPIRAQSHGSLMTSCACACRAYTDDRRPLDDRRMKAKPLRCHLTTALDESAGCRPTAYTKTASGVSLRIPGQRPRSSTTHFVTSDLDALVEDSSRTRVH